MGMLVGRGPELEQLRAAQRGHGRPLDVVIRGEAGVGKTTLWQSFTSELEEEGATVLVGRPAESAAAVPYATLTALLDGVLADEQLAALPDPQRVALEAVTLRRSPPPGETTELSVDSGVLRVLEHLAGLSPLVLALDDAQWIDAPSARSLAVALRRLRGADVTVLSTVRTPHQSAIGHDHGGPRFELALQGLDIDGLDELITTQLGRRLLLPALIQLRRASGGNPFAALEIVRAAAARGVDLDTETDLPVPERLEALLRARIDALPPDTRRVLLLAASAAAPDVELLEAALPALDVLPLLRGAERAGVLQLQRGVVRFAHPLLAQVVTEAATRSETREAHTQLAAVVTDAVDRARHIAAAATDPDEEVARTIEAGAAQAEDRAALATAGLLYERSLRLTPGDRHEALARRTVAAVRLRVAAGSPQRAADIATRTVELLPASPPRGRTLAALAEARSDRRSLPLLEQAAVEVEGDDAATAVVYRRLAWMRAASGDLRHAVRDATTALAAAERHDDPEELAATLAAVAKTLFLRGDPAASAVLSRAIATLPSDARSTQRRELERDRTMMACWGDHPDAASLVERQRRDACDRGDPGDEGQAMWFALLIRSRTGPWTDLLQQAAGLAQASRRLDPAGEPSGILWLRSLIEAQLGRVEDARRHAEAGIRAARGEGSAGFELWCEGVLGSLELALGDHESAAERLWQLERRREETGCEEPGHLRYVADAVEALVASARLAEAGQLVARLEELGRRTGDRWAQAASLRCRALVREAGGDRTAALDDLLLSVERHEQLGQPLELARTLLAHGAVLRRAKRKAAARQALERSVGILDAIPAPLWVERARRELARVAGPTASRWELTPTERRIAELVARGRTNREVAAELFLSAKTVEWNLSKVYRKLAVRSRSELAASWGARDDEPGGLPGSTGVGLP